MRLSGRDQHTVDDVHNAVLGDDVSLLYASQNGSSSVLKHNFGAVELVSVKNRGDG